MRHLLTIFPIAALLTMCGRGENEATHALAAARSFTGAGDYARALERHEWYHHNALRIAPAQFGVRLSFALADWKRLGDLFPPALNSLRTIRDAGTAALEAGAAPTPVFHDVESINESLGESGKTIDLFKSLDSKNRALAEACFHYVRDTLLEAGEGDLFIRYAGDLEAFVKQKIERHADSVRHLRSRSMPNRESVLKTFDNSLVEAALAAANLAREQGEPDKAARILKL